MGSIPVPQLRLTPQPDPLEQYGRVISLQSMLQQQQMAKSLQPGQMQAQQQQLQAGAQENQIRQQQIQDQQTAMQVIGANAGDIGKSIPELAGKISPMALQSILKAHIDTSKTVADLTKTQLENQSTQNNNLLGIVQQAKALPPDQYAQQWPQIATQALQASPQLKGRIDPAQPIPQASLDQLSIGLQSQSQYLAQEAAKRAAAAQAETARHNQADEANAATETPKLEMKDWLAKNPGKGPADYEVAMKKVVPAFNFNMQNSGAAATNGQPSAMAAALANGQMKWTEAVNNRTPLNVKQDLLKQVLAIKPDYNSGDFQIQQDVKKDFTSGAAATSLTAFNTAIEHATQLSSAIDALGNGNVTPLNKLGNVYDLTMGKDNVTNFNVVKNALSGEISKVFKGGGATDAEIAQVQGPFSAANSPAQLKGAVRQAISLMNSKRTALQQQYSQGLQAKPNFGGQSGIKVTDPAGGVHTFPDQASANKFKQLAGIQ